MVILQVLLAALLHSVGRILNTVFGWATIMLFGKVPQERQIYLSMMAFGSVIWIVVFLGIPFPAFATFLLTFVSLPAWIDKAWIRLAMLVAAVAIPPAVGLAALFVRAPEERPADVAGRVTALLQGYPYTVGLAMTLVMLILFAPVMKLRSMLRRWTDRHVPVIVRPQDYMEVVNDVQRALAAGGIKTRREQASQMLRLPARILSLLARGAAKELVADQLVTLTAPHAEVLLYPADLVISAREREAARAQAIISEHLTFTRAYLTWTREAHGVEDRLRSLWADLEKHPTGRAAAEVLEKLCVVERELKELKLPYEEWEVLFRKTLLMELTLLREREPERQASVSAVPAR